MMRTPNIATRLLDHLSGTWPNDERTSRINEKGFALCGLFYILAFAVRGIWCLTQAPFGRDALARSVNGTLDLPVLAVMLVIMAAVTVTQRRRETPVPQKAHAKLSLAELPRAAAALLSGRSPEDERTVQAFERGFVACGVIGIAYCVYCWLLIVWSRYLLSTFVLLVAAPVLVGYVKLRENILTPPRFLHIPLDTAHLLRRLPVYLIGVVPYLFLASYVPTIPEHMAGTYSESLFVMFWQVIGETFVAWLHGPWHLAPQFLYYAGMIYLAIVIVHEFTVFLYRRQMARMDVEENDLT